jgi:hypothetical protein
VTWIRNRPLGLVFHDTEKASNSYTLFSPVRGYHADLLDPAGRIVHQWRHQEGIQHAKWLPNGHLLAHTAPPQDNEGLEHIGGAANAMIELDADSKIVWRYDNAYNAMIELDADSKIVWRYDNAYQHHDFQRLPNGHTLVIAWAKIPPEISARVQGGHAGKDDPDWMWGDIVLEIDRRGRTLREWRSWEHLSTDHHVMCPLESRKEWTHCNSIEVTPTGDWLLSFRLTNTVVIVDGKTGDVRWRWGAEQLSHQHNATWLDNGNILIFDNGCHRVEMPSFSSIVEVDPKTGNTPWTYAAEPILAFYSFMISGAQRLPNGNTFITEGATGRLFEITKERETVWEYVSPWIVDSRFGPTPAVFRAYRIPANDKRLKAVRKDSRRYRKLNARIDNNETLGTADEGL